MIRPSKNLIFYGIISCCVMVPSYFYWGSMLSMFVPILLIVSISTFDLFRSIPLLGLVDILVDKKTRGLSSSNFSLPIEFESKCSYKLNLCLIFKNSLWAKDIEELNVSLPPDCKSIIMVKGQFAKRGKYAFGSIGLILHSAFYLWELQRTVEIGELVRVYPSFIEQRRVLSSQLFNNKNFGFHRYRQIGKGKEFERLREYEPGDSFEDISWKATAKRGSPVSKVYQIEKTQEIYLAIDCSRLSMKEFQNNKGETHIILEKYIEVAFLLGEYCATNGDKFGLILFSDHINKFIKAKSGKQHLNYCKEVLYNLSATSLSPDFGDVFSEINERIPKRSFILFLSNLEDIAEAESFAEKVRFISRKHLTLVQMMQTDDIMPIFSNTVNNLTEIAGDISGHLRWSRIMQTKKALKLKGVDFDLIKDSQFSLTAINSYIAVKQKQAI